MSDPLLSGIRVVEVSSWLSGPVASLILAEAGADVVKVEPPGGDPARAVAGFATWNRSKGSVVVDLETPSGREDLQSLIASADVLVHSLRPSAALRTGIDDDNLARRHPGLVWSVITGWPHGHPDEDRAGHEILLQAATGVMDEELGTRPGPVFLRFPYGSWNAALFAVVGILARLRVRDATGLGGPVHTSVFQGLLAPMSKHWSRSATPSPTMSYPNLFKGMNMVQLCGDGLGIVPTMGDVSIEEVPLFSEVLAELPPEATADPMGVTAEALKRRTRQEWLDAMWAVGMPTAKVASHLGEPFGEEQFRANDYVVEVDDPEWGRTVQAGHPFRVDPPLTVKGPAPRLGEHAGTSPGPRKRPDGSRPVPTPGGPLAGVRVLDFGMFLAGPYGPQLMADLGADVIKVEATTGDRLRRSERIFAGCQRGKRSVAVDLRSPESRPVLERLVQWADVVHHNLRLPPARLLGLGYETVRAMKPSIVYCHVSSYGPEGPRRDWPGVDPTSQAVVGWMQEGAGTGNPPRWYRIGMTDDQCAISSVIAVLLALRHRDRTGAGADVRASILGTAALTTSETMLLGDGSIAPYPTMDREQTGLGPGYRIYECADGWISVAAPGSAALERLRAAVGGNDTSMEAEFRARRVGELAQALDQAGVAAEPVRMDQEQAFFDSDLYRRLGLSVEYQHPEYGRLEQIGSALSFGDLDLTIDRPPPVLGEHTLEVLAEVGVDRALVARLASAGLLEGPGLRP
jgi:crotonobetainyl-CoA:carnitine CoA-transferase CaiB-like acyl-CoA transferase